jgi:hypothetical protein
MPLSGIQFFLWIPAKLVLEWFDRFGGSILGFVRVIQRLEFPATDIIQLDFNNRSVKQTHNKETRQFRRRHFIFR